MLGRFPPMDQPLVFLDVETATTRGAPHLVEVGAVRVEGGEAVDTFTTLVCPDVAVDPAATETHGLTVDDLRAAPDAAAALASFTAWCGDAWLAAFAARFDAQALGFGYARAGVGPPPGPLVDVLPLAKKAFPDAADHKLETLVEELGIDAAPRHRALPDAVATWQVCDRAVAALGGWDALGAAGLLERAGLPLRLADAGPRAPRRRRARVQALVRAARDAASVTLIYGEPGEEPARLAVTPRLVYEMSAKGYLEGLCGRSGLLKTYRIDRIQKVLP
jgi:DNA polymerase III epsilon subunit-like protein